MSYELSGVLQPCGLLDSAILHSASLSCSRKFDIWWAIAETRIAELLHRIQPNGHSESLRKDVSDYVSALVQQCLGCEVVQFGSVPLKTYLPDGDIDLTAFSNHQGLSDSWGLNVQAVLENEVHKKDSRFTVRNVQFIHAEVKIVKCVVESIVVDISFNQLGGVCTLCFLEEVDRLVQKDHLFKRSIILVKAWCYYESRILGAHHGLISTYALETLVLYIFNIFHSTLRGPLEVLFTFLDYFSKFDWECYCISVWGPIPLSSLPDLRVEPLVKEGDNLLLSKAFLERCNSLYDVPSKGGDAQFQTFSRKYLNIVDPLRINNNLGRSVSRANFHRIKRAFKLGARQLAQVFETIDEDFPKCLDDFFSNTWERHQSGHRPDAPESFFPPYEKFVYKSGYLDMLGDPGAEYLLKVPEVGNSIPSSVEKIIRNEKIIASRLESRMQNMVSKSSECIQNRDPPIKDSKSSKEIPDDEVSEVCRQETDVLSVFHSGYPRQEISNNMQSTVMYSMALAANADFQLKMSSHNKGCLEKAQNVVPSQRSLAAASRETVVSENRIETSVDEIMKASDCPRNMKKFNVLRRTSSHGHLPISYGPVDDWNSAQVIRAGKYNFSEVSSSQETCRQGSMSHTQESREWSTVRRAALDTSSCRAEDSIMAKVSTGGKTHSILLTESSDMQYAAGMLPALPPVLSASSSSTVVSSQFTCPSMSAQIESETKRLSYSSSEQNEPCSLHSLDSGKLPLDDGQKITRSDELGKLPDLEIYSQHQLLEEGEQLQYPQKLEQHPKTSNVNLEEPQHLFSNCGSINPGVQKNDDVSGILGGLNVSAPMKMEECMKSVELNQKTKSSRREFSHTDSRTRKKAVRYKAPEVLPAMCVTKATTSGLNQGLSSKGGSGIQQPINFRDASQSVVFGATVTKMHPAQEGEKSQGHMSYFPPIPIISYQNTIYNTFPVSSFSPNVQHKYKTSIDGMSRGSSPFRYQNSRQLSEPMAAALSARFASLSIEDNGLECQHDLLRSDLYNHLRNLEVGRLCQEPFQQTLLEPPYSCQNAQDFSLWNFIPSMPQASASNQMIGKFKGPFSAMSFPHSVGSIPCFKSDRNASGFSQLCGQETRRRTSMSLRNAMFEDLQSSSLQDTFSRDQQSMRKRNQFISTIYAPSTPAYVEIPFYHDAYDVRADQIVYSEAGVIGPNSSNRLPGRTSSFVTGPLEFGSIGPMEITNLQSSSMSNPPSSRNTVYTTESDSFSSFIRALSDKRPGPRKNMKEEKSV